MLICILLIFLLSITVSFASENIDDATSDIISEESMNLDERINEESMDDSSQNLDLLSASADESESLKNTNDNILKEDEVGDFAELSDLIHSQSVINLTKDYKNVDGYKDTHVTYNYGHAVYYKGGGYTKTIDGCGHTIDFNHYANNILFAAYDSSSASITFKNIIFKNGVNSMLYFGDNPGFGAINLKVINCSFSNDQPFMANKSTGAITCSNFRNGNILIKDCNFTNNAGTNGIPFYSDAGAKITFDNCIFKNNSVNAASMLYRGGIIVSHGTAEQFNLYNCIFEDNTVASPIYRTGNGLDYTHSGGVVYITCGYGKTINVNIENTTFLNSKNLYGNGGAIYFGPIPGSGTPKNFDFDVKISNTSFINSTSGHYGGAIYMAGYDGKSNDYQQNVYYKFKMDIANNTSFINSTAKNGGAVFVDAPWITGKTSCDVDINIHNDVLFENNQVVSSAGQNVGGGALYVGYSIGGTVTPQNIKDYSIDVKIHDNVSFVGNSAKINSYRNCGGGAIYVFTHSNLEIDNCSFKDNYVKFNNYQYATNDAGGGAIFVGKPNDQAEELISTLSINNTSFNNNYVDGKYAAGGAVFVKDVSSNNITDTVFDANGVNANSGSAIYFENTCDNKLSNVTFSNNVASGNAVGGALSFSNDANNEISGCNFVNNSITSGKGNGGAIYYKDGAGQGENTYVNTTFEGNTATNGGAVYIGSGWKDINFTDTEFANNSAYTGGALYLNGASAIINNASMNGNKANKSGGAVYADNAELDVDNSNFNDNNANKSGGALYILGDSTVTVDGTDFINNSATNMYGGAMFAGINTNTTIDHCNFYNNSAFEGSAINYQAQTGVEGIHSISNSEFYDNLADSIDLDASVDKNTNTLDVVYSGGDNLINAIKSYDDVDFDNVTYYAYNQGTKNTDEKDYKKSYLIPYQTIHVVYLDANGNVIGTEDIITDENGRASANVPLDAVYVHVFRDGDSYYTDVSSDLDSRLGDFDIIQRRILATAENGILRLDRDFVYTLDLDTITEGIVIDRPITIDGQGWSIDALFKSRVFKVLVDNVTFRNITFYNATNWDGSFIYGYDVENIRIENCTFKNPLEYDEVFNPPAEELDEDEDIIITPLHTFDGGAVYIVGNDTLTTDSKFINLIAYHGGAMYLNGTNHTIKNSYYNYTRAINAGGAVFAIGEDFNIEDCEFENCFADVNGTGDVENLDMYILYRDPGDYAVTPRIMQGGGAVYFEGVNLNITNSNFTNCTTYSFGGAVYSNGVNTKITRSNFTNSMAITGGAVFMDRDAASSGIDNAVFINNTATANGGAISWYAAEGVLNNSQFTNNSQRITTFDMTNGGGAVYWFGVTGRISNSNFTDNRVTFPFDNPEYDPDGHWDVIWYGDWGEDIWIEPNLQKYLNFNINDTELLRELFKNYSKGGAILIRGTDIHIQDCLFDQNYAQSGGAIAVDVVQDPVFTGGNGYWMIDKSGYMIWVGEPQQEMPNVEIVNSTFTDNFAQYGGAVIIENTWNINAENILTDCKFYNNTAYMAGALYLAANRCTVEKSIFEDNAAFIGGAILDGYYTEEENGYWDENDNWVSEWVPVVRGNNNNVLNSTFKGNLANYGGALFWFGDDGVISENCHFIENNYADSFNRYAQGLLDCYGMEINASDYYQIKDYEITETDSETGDTITIKLIEGLPEQLFEGCGGAIAWMGLNGFIIESEFTNNSAIYGGAVFAVDLMGYSAEDYPLITIGACNFTNNTASSGGAVSVMGAYAGIYESNFTDNTASANEPASEYSNIFQFSEDNDGGAVFWMGQKSIIDTCDFTNNKADLGGAISIKEYSIEGDLIFASENSTIQNCNFNNNSANNGGAIYNEATGVEITGIFTNNTAAEKGGAIYNKGNGLTVSDSEFTFNRADMGSAVFDTSSGMNIAQSAFLDNKAGASSIIITSNEVNGNEVTISARFKGNDNLINAMHVMNMPAFDDVYYWGADGLTTTNIHNPSISDAEAGQNITFELSNNDNSYELIGVTDWDGVATVTISDVRSGRYYGVASHRDDTYYTEINSMTMINVGKVETPINIEIEDIFYRENATAIIKLNKDTTGNLTIRIDGENYTTVDLTGKNGVVVLENITGLNVGTHNITAVYDGDKNYDNSSKTVKFNVKPIASALNITTNGGYYKDNITVNVTVGPYDDMSGKVIVTIEDEFGRTLTINDTTKLQLVINTLKVGEYNITAYYIGDNNYLPCSNQTTLTVMPIELNPVVSAANVTVEENTTFTLTLPDDFVGKVNITVGDITMVYDVAGSTQVTFANLPAGNKTARVVFYGDKDYNTATVYPVNFTVTEKEQIIYSMNVTVTDATYPDKSVAEVNVSGGLNGTAVIMIDDKPFTLTLVNGTGRVDITGLSAGVKTANVNFTSTDKKVNLTGSTKFEIHKAKSKIDIKIDDHDVIVNVTGGATGEVAFYVNGEKHVFELNNSAAVWKDILSVGNNTIVVVYEGDVNYTESENNTIASVDKLDSIVNVTANNTVYGSDAVITVKTPIEQTGYVTITVNNNNYTQELKNGVAVFNIPGLAVKEYPINVTYNGNDKYSVQTNSTTFNVTKADLNITVIALNITVNDNSSFIIINTPSDFHGKVNITVDDKHYTGDASSLIMMDRLSEGNKTAKVIFYGDDNYKDLPLNVTFTVSKITAQTTVNVTVEDVTYPAHSIANITVSGNANGTVIVTVDDKEYEPVEIVNGTVIIDLGSLPAGVRDISVRFITNDNVNTNASASTKFNVKKAKSQVNITVDGYDVTATVNPDATGEVTFYVNGEKQVIEVNNSQATWKNILNIGNNTIIAVYEGDVNYTESENNTDFYIKKLDSYVNVTANNTVYGKDAVIIVNAPANQTGYVTITVNNNNYTQMLKDGRAVFNIPGLSVNEYSVKAVYLGSDKYDTIANETSFNVTPAALEATAVAENITVLDNATFIISHIPNDFKGKVNITVDNKTIVCDADALIRTPSLTSGLKQATVTLWGDENYYDLTLYVNFTVSRIPTTVNVKVDEVTYPDMAKAIVEVSGKANGTVIITVDGEKFNATVIDGFATVNLTGLSAGIKQADVEFIVSDMINSNASTAVKFNIKKAKSTVNITVNGKNVTATVTPGATGNVTFYVDGVKQVIELTDGKATWNDALQIGNNTIIVVYEGDNNYTESENNTNAYIEKLTSLVNVSAESITYGSEAVIIVNVPTAQTGYVTILVDNQNHTMLVKDGKATFHIQGLSVNEYSVKVTYLGDDKYSSNVNETSFNVTKADLNASVIAENITVIQNSEFIITVPADYAGKVNITVDNETYTGDVNSLISLGKLTSGAKTANVSFYGDANYNDLNMTVDFTVSELPVHVDVPSVNADNMTRGYNSPYDYQAAFLDSEGNALANAEVEFRVNGKSYKVKTNKDGIAQLTTSKLDVGVYNVTSVNLVTGEQETRQLSIVARIIENKDMTMDFASGKYFTVKVIGDDGNIAPEGEIIDIYANSIHYVAKVNKNGYAKLKINLNPKKYKITAEYKTYKTTNKLVVKQVLKLVKKTIKAKKSKKLVLKAKLKWSNGKPIKGKKIVFKFKGKKYNAKTNKKGVAKVTLKKKVSKKLKKGKKYTYSASFKTNKVKGKVVVK